MGSLSLGTRAGASIVVALRTRDEIAAIQFVQNLVRQRFVLRAFAPGLGGIDVTQRDKGLHGGRKAGRSRRMRPEADEDERRDTLAAQRDNRLLIPLAALESVVQPPDMRAELGILIVIGNIG